MSAYRRRLAGRQGSVILLGVAAVLAMVLASSFLASGKALTEAEARAEARAEDYVASVLSAELTPALVSSDVIGADYRDLLVTIQSEILSSDAVTRLRIWKTGGDLIFSTAQRDRVEQYVAIDHPQIGRAAQGETVSILSKAVVPSKAGLEGSNERLYQTFVPLRLGGSLAASGVVEIDQRYSAIQDEADRIWRLVQIALIVLLVGVAALFANSLRGPARGLDTPQAPRPSREERRQREAEDRALVSEHAARQAGIGQRLAEAELKLRGAGNTEVPHDLRRHVEELQLKVRAEREERQRQDGEIQRLRAALAEKQAELALASEAARSDSAAPADLVLLDDPPAGDPDPRFAEAADRAAEAERRLAEAERRAAAAAKRGDEADARIVELEAALRDAKRAAAEAAGRDEAMTRASAELREAQLLVKDLTLRLSEVEGSNGQLAKAKAAGEAAKAEARKAKEQAAAATAEAEETRSELARSRTEVDPLREELHRLREELGRASAETERLRSEREASKAEQEASRAELEAARAELEAARAELEAARAELEAARAELGASTLEPGGDRQAAEGAGLLEARIAELEAQRRSEIGELQRAQESLANTQIELMEATRKLKAAEERVHALELGRQATPSQTSPDDRPPRRLEPEPGYVAARPEGVDVAQTSTPHTVRDPRGPFASTAEPSEPEPDDEDGEAEAASEKGLSLRERLSRAAAARHRGPGAAG